MPTLGALSIEEPWRWNTTHVVLVNLDSFVGVGCLVPSGTEKLRVTGSAVLGGAVLFDGVFGATPVSGAGTRFMWCPAKRALRAGEASAAEWDDASVGTYSVALGYGGSAAGTASFSAGTGHNASGENAVALGAYNASTALASVAVGRYAIGVRQGQFSRAGGRFASTGDCQRSDVGMFRASTDAGAVELTLDGNAPAAGNRLYILSGKLYKFQIHVSCHCTAGTNLGACATWEFEGGIKNIAGTTTLVGVPSASFIGDAALAAAVCALTADDPNDSLAITCTGIVGGAANTFHWNATVYATEVV